MCNVKFYRNEFLEPKLGVICLDIVIVKHISLLLEKKASHNNSMKI